METVPGALWHGSWLHWRVSVSLHWGVVVLQTSKLHSSCQIRWQFVIYPFPPLSKPTPNSPERNWCPGKQKHTLTLTLARTHIHSQNRKKKNKTPPSPSTFAASADHTQEPQQWRGRWTGRADVASWWLRGGLNSSTPLLLQGFNSHRNQSLKRGHGAYLVERRESKQVNKSL